MHLVVDEKGVFREENFQKAILTLNKAGDAHGGGSHRNNKRQAGVDCYKIIKMIMERHYDPVIVFSFSKRDCESLALQMSKLDFNEKAEKKAVDAIFNNAIDTLAEDDKKLPQVEHLLPLLRRGIGIHHSGLLPILKEVIEILFQEGLIKVA